MKRQGWLQEKKIHDQIYFRLTREGRFHQRLLKFRLMSKHRAHYATVIMFDIPESKSNFRHFLRRFLLQNKFTMLQKSVFITPDSLPEEFYDILRELGLLQYTTTVQGRVIHKL